MPGWDALRRAERDSLSALLALTLTPSLSLTLTLTLTRCNLSFGLKDSESGLVGPMAAVADIDGDGRLDVAVTDGGSRVMLFANRAGGDRPWVCVTPAGTRSNRGAVGALIRFHQGGRTIRRDVMPRSMAQDFGPTSCTGLYEDGDVDVEICWPRDGDGRCSFH